MEMDVVQNVTYCCRKVMHMRGSVEDMIYS